MVANINLLHLIRLRCKSNIMKTPSPVEEREIKRMEFDYIDRAVNGRLLTDAIPPVFDEGAFACCVSTLGRFASL